jgi:SOS response regulatory protein OraA/RecX
MDQAITRLPELVGKINQYNMITMTPEQQRDFALKALALRSYSDRQPTEEELAEFLAPRRNEDQGDSLWVILNRVQESVIKGGYHLQNAKGKFRKAKSIKNIQQDIKLNQAVWELATEYA